MMESIFIMSVLLEKLVPVTSVKGICAYRKYAYDMKNAIPITINRQTS